MTTPSILKSLFGAVKSGDAETMCSVVYSRLLMNLGGFYPRKPGLSFGQGESAYYLNEVDLDNASRLKVLHKATLAFVEVGGKSEADRLKGFLREQWGIEWETADFPRPKALISEYLPMVRRMDRQPILRSAQ